MVYSVLQIYLMLVLHFLTFDILTFDILTFDILTSWFLKKIEGRKINI